jgi:hypothetical protein
MSWHSLRSSRSPGSAQRPRRSRAGSAARAGHGWRTLRCVSARAPTRLRSACPPAAAATCGCATAASPSAGRSGWSPSSSRATSAPACESGARPPARRIAATSSLSGVGPRVSHRRGQEQARLLRLETASSRSVSLLRSLSSVKLKARNGGEWQAAVPSLRMSRGGDHRAVRSHATHVDARLEPHFGGLAVRRPQRQQRTAHTP